VRATCAFPAVAASPVGAEGTTTVLLGVALTSDDSGEVPALFTAATL